MQAAGGPAGAAGWLQHGRHVTGGTVPQGECGGNHTSLPVGWRHANPLYKKYGCFFVNSYVIPARLPAGNVASLEGPILICPCLLDPGALVPVWPALSVCCGTIPARTACHMLIMMAAAILHWRCLTLGGCMDLSAIHLACHLTSRLLLTAVEHMSCFKQVLSVS